MGPLFAMKKSTTLVKNVFSFINISIFNRTFQLFFHFALESDLLIIKTFNYYS